MGGILDDLEDQANLAESSRLAQAIHGALVRGTRAPDRGVKQAPFHVLAGARMAAVLLELGFVSHPVEGKDLARPARQEAIAGAIAAGIAAWRTRRHRGCGPVLAAGPLAPAIAHRGGALAPLRQDPPAVMMRAPCAPTVGRPASSGPFLSK